MLPEVVAQIPWPEADFIISHNIKTVQVKPPLLPPNSTSPSSSSFSGTSEGLSFHCTKVFDRLIEAMMSRDLFPKLLNRTRSEPFLVMGSAFPGTHIQRFPAPLFGIASRGAHMTVYVKDSEPSPGETCSTESTPLARGGIKIWVATRSPNLWTYPGKLDTSVAGGVKATDAPADCITAEAYEEAGLDPARVRRDAVAKGCITYVTRGRSYGTVTPTALYVFDMEVSPEVSLQPVDKEVEKFELMTVEEIKIAMFSGLFKPNCNLVMLDFFIRHGLLVEAEIQENGGIKYLSERLRRKLPVPLEPEEGL